MSFENALDDSSDREEACAPSCQDAALDELSMCDEHARQFAAEDALDDLPSDPDDCSLARAARIPALDDALDGLSSAGEEQLVDQDMLEDAPLSLVAAAPVPTHLDGAGQLLTMSRYARTHDIPGSLTLDLARELCSLGYTTLQSSVAAAKQLNVDRKVLGGMRGKGSP